MTRRFILALAVALLASLHPASAQVASTLVEDDFDGLAGAPPDATQFEWSGEVVQNGSGQLVFSTETVNQSWLCSITGAAPDAGQTLVLQMRAYAYAENWNPGIYGDGQPRGLRVGSDANNVAEFYSLARTSVGLRLRKDGVESLADYALPSGVDSMHDYAISVTTTSVCFMVDGALAGTFTNNIPTGVLNVYVSTFDGYAGNVPVSLDSVSLSLSNNEVAGIPPGITDQPVSVAVDVTSNATFSVTATGTAPLACQWRKDGGDLSDATNSVLTLTNVQANQAGNYTVLITNAWGSVTSSVAVLTVNCPNVAAWGIYENGVSVESVYVPVDLTNAVAVAAGRGHTLALRDDGTVFAWGYNNYGQANVPSDLTQGAAVAAGELHSLALGADGMVAAWGANNYGQCNVPTGLSNVVAVAVGGNHNLALRADGTAFAWGINWADQCDVPAGLSNVVAVAAGGYYYASFSLALRSDGTVTAWGFNDNGQCNVPAGLSNVVAVAAGTVHSLALKADGTVVAWGWNGYGECNVPGDLTNVVAVAGGYHSLALKSDGTVVAWGYNEYGQCNASGVTNVAAIAAGDYHSAVLFGVGKPFLPPMVNQIKVSPGEMVFLKACPTGELPMSCQWQKNGAALPGATNALLAISNAGLTNAGSYQVVVSNFCGSVTSQVTVLTVMVSCPVITSFSPTNGSVGAVIAINGSGFSNANGVKLNGTDLPFTVVSDSQITATVISGATSGLITVVSANGTASSSNNFCVLEALDFIYTTNNGTITITGYTGSGGAVIIPDTINGLPVTSIGMNAFYSCTSLTNVTIPDNVTSIGDTAFAYCTGLANVTIGSGVTNIGYHAFFSCPSLMAITVDPANSSLSSVDGVLFDKGQTTLILFPEAKTGSYTVPDSVTGIGDGAFDHCAGLASVMIPDSVTNIASGAFYSCTSLTNVTIGNGVTTIGNLAFCYCINLTNVTIPDSVTTINGAFSDCTGLAGITLGNSLTDIGGAFVRCANLASVTIPGSVTSIGDMAFAGCSSLTNVMIPDSVTGIGSSAFSACTSLASITIPDSVTNIGNYAFDHCTSLNNVAIGNSVTSIGSDAFYFCTSLSSVTIPNSVTSIGISAFSVCTSLTSITIPNSLTNIADYTFSGCYGLTDVTIPNSISTIGSGAFAACYHLTSITIPDSVTSIGDWAFNACYGLTCVTIPNSVTSVGGYAFYNCTSLSSVTMGTNVTSIGTDAFAWCNSLANITIPNSVSSIGYAAFYNCSQLTGIYFQGNAPSVGSSVFDGANNTTVYYLPGTTGWNPQVQTRDASFGVRTNQFGFNITGSSSVAIVVEACTNLASPIWSPVGTNTFTGGSSNFSDPQWTNYPARFYRLSDLTLGGRPVVLWNPQVQTRDASFGARTNHFGFTITGSSNLVIVVEACTNLAHPVWSPVGTNTLTGGSSYFSDPQWTNYPSRFYRLRSP